MTENEINAAAFRKLLRQQKIACRDGLGAACRREYSRIIAEKISALPEFKGAKNIMLYRAVGGEVSLDALTEDGRRFAYPLCVSNTEMLALVPENDGAWQRGRFGILEPIREKSAVLLPHELDLVICPCTAFDESCNRMGMGGGYYDRFLPKCVNAAVIAAAFEVQRVPSFPAEPWDVPMSAVVTEKNVYRAK